MNLLIVWYLVSQVCLLKQYHPPTQTNNDITHSTIHRHRPTTLHTVPSTDTDQQHYTQYHPPTQTNNITHSTIHLHRPTTLHTVPSTYTEKKKKNNNNNNNNNNNTAPGSNPRLVIEQHTAPFKGHFLPFVQLTFTINTVIVDSNVHKL
jgi:hypothetical protein